MNSSPAQCAPATAAEPLSRLAVPATASRGMLMATVVGTGDMAAHFRRFSTLIGPRHWTKCVQGVKEVLRGNPFLRDFLTRENEIATSLSQYGELLDRYGDRVDVITGRLELYPALAFATQVLSIADGLPAVKAKRFVRRVQGAFGNPDDMRGLRLELTVATHFIRRGQVPVWPEMSEELAVQGQTQFDFLLPALGTGLEIECKSISGDKGRRIRQREALEFHHLVFERNKQLIDRLEDGLAVVVTVPDRLPAQYQARVELVRAVRSQLLSAQSASLADGTEIRIADFDTSAAPRGDPSAMRTFIESVSGTRNRDGMLRGNGLGGALVFVTRSARDDEMMDATFRTLGDAARRQLSGNRAGLLVAGFDAISSEGLQAVAAQDLDPHQPETALNNRIRRFFSGDGRNHIVNAAFLSRGAIQPVGPGELDSGGSVYNFPNRGSRYWSEDFANLFNPPQAN